MLLVIDRWETGSCLHMDKSSLWPFDVGTFTMLREAKLLSASWRNVVGTGCQSGLGEGKHGFIINLSPSTAYPLDS